MRCKLCHKRPTTTGECELGCGWNGSSRLAHNLQTDQNFFQCKWDVLVTPYVVTVCMRYFQPTSSLMANSAFACNLQSQGLFCSPDALWLLVLSNCLINSISKRWIVVCFNLAFHREGEWAVVMWAGVLQNGLLAISPVNVCKCRHHRVGLCVNADDGKHFIVLVFVFDSITIIYRMMSSNAMA